MKRYILLLFLILIHIDLLATNYPIKTIEQLDYNREAQTLSRRQLSDFPDAHTGFMFNNGDNATLKWRPQGIAGFVRPNGQRYIAVSWYGLEAANYQDRGTRISIANVSQMSRVRYRHILLVDENGNPFTNMHAGGLVYRQGKFHVPDSRCISNTSICLAKKSNRADASDLNHYQIHTFSIDAIEEVPSADRDSFHNYRYIIRRESSYTVDIKPSFLSYNWDNNEFVVGAYNNCRNDGGNEDGPHDNAPECFKDKNKIGWYSSIVNNEISDFRRCGYFYSEMQGAALASSRAAGYDRNFWISASWGRGHDSTLYYGQLNTNTCEFTKIASQKKIYPAGLEDIHYALTSDNIWMLTEFGSNERASGHNNNRVVFAVKKHLVTP